MADMSERRCPVNVFEGSPFRCTSLSRRPATSPRRSEAVEGIEDGLMFQTLLGVTGSGKTYTMANVIARSAGRRWCWRRTRRWRRSCIRSSASSSRERGRVFRQYYDYYQPEAYVPSRDLFIEKDSAINEHIEQMRLSATKSLLERRDVVIVAPCRASTASAIRSITTA
jgi:excinuclease ABC subunit B